METIMLPQKSIYCITQLDLRNNNMATIRDNLHLLCKFLAARVICGLIWYPKRALLHQFSLVY